VATAATGPRTGQASVKHDRLNDSKTGSETWSFSQLAFPLHLTQPSAAAQMDYAATVTARLPHTFAALRAGRVHPVHVRIIEDETRVLSAADAARADAELAATAGSLTFGKLRAAAHRLVLELDPDAAGKRKEAARCDLDHTTAWDQGEITCECGLAPPRKR
jgi:hypothetical protein